jgi:tetratricopeptide (TPR) repeat protein
VGRENELDQLHEILQQQEGAVISAVSGMGGVGKTQLAVEYATRHAADYPGGVCWLKAREQDLATQIIQIAEFDLNLKILEDPQMRSLPSETIVQKCWQRWKPDGLVLVVLDDVTDWATCQRFLPRLSRFRLLLTTRIQRLDADLFEIALDVLSIDDAITLLAKLEKGERVDRDQATAIELCEALGRLPLGIELIGRYLFSRRALSLSKMLEQLLSQALEIEALERLPQYAMTAQLGVKAAFEVTWHLLSEDGQTVARLLGFFALDEISWQVAEAMMRRVKGEEYSIFEAQTELENASMVQIVEEKPDVCKLHPLVREFLRNKEESETLLEVYLPILSSRRNLSINDMNEESAAEERTSILHSLLREAFLAELISLASQMPYNPTIDDIVALTPIHIHLQEIAIHYVDELQGSDLLWMFAGLAWFYEGQGLFLQAEPWCTKCLQITESRFQSDNSFDVAWSLNELAYLYQIQGRLNEAEPLYAKSLEMRQRLFAGDHPAVALGLNNLAYLYKLQGRLNEAEPLYAKSLEMRQRLFGDDHAAVASSLNNLALLYDSQGRLGEAEPLYVKSLEIRQRLFAGDHPDMASSLNNLAALYQVQRRLGEAEPLYVKSLEMRHRLFAGDHPDTASSLNNLALLYKLQGRLSAAEPLYVESLEMRHRLFANNHPDVAQSLNNLALLYQAQGRFEDAIVRYKQALTTCERILGMNHPNTQTVRANLESLCQ